MPDLGETAHLATLSEEIASHGDMETREFFVGVWRGRTVLVRAMLTRTAVVAAAGERHVARLDEVLVDPAAIPWVPRTLPKRCWNGLRGMQAGASAAICGKCGALLSQSNTAGDCKACRSICACGAEKAPQALRCRKCATRANREHLMRVREARQEVQAARQG